MADALDEELAALQARAYGPGGGIADDPIALARLRELELRRAEAREPVDAAEPFDSLEALFAADEPEPAASVVPVLERIEPPVELPAEQPAAPPVAPVSLSVEPPVRRLDRRLRLAWIASLVVAVVLATGITAWTLPWGVRDEEHHEARLTAQPGEISDAAREQLGAWVERIGGGEELLFFGDYSGLSVYAVGPCLFTFAPREDEEQGSFSNGTCGSETLTPTLDVYVPPEDTTSQGTTDYPAELLQRFRDGGVVRFQLLGDSVVVDSGPLPDGFYG